eukprot:Hpha_TRINITY_DN15465_c3_g3::TRINITY_DN15465_c3_g3_i1::g.175177::m.175177/K07767/KATNA1; katanin p60 ATPase-containing subunit A1
MGGDADIGMQRAIWNSIQSGSSRAAPARAAPPRPLPQSYQRDIVPTQPRTAHSTTAGGNWPAASRAAASLRAETSRREPAVGRRGLLAREGIHAQPGRSSAGQSRASASAGFGAPPPLRSPTQRGSGGAAAAPRSYDREPRRATDGDVRDYGRRPSGGRLSHINDSPNLLRRSENLSGWTTVMDGGKLQRRNPSGSELQATSEEGWSLPSFRELPKSHTLVSVTDLPGELAESTKPVTISFTVKPQLHTSRSLLFGLVFNYQKGSDGNAEWLCAAVSHTETSRAMHAQVLRYHLTARAKSAVVVEEATQSESVGSVSQQKGMQLAITRSRDRLDVHINGKMVFKNVAVSVPPSAQFGLCAVGTRAQVQNLTCREGTASELQADSALRSSIDTKLAETIEKEVLLVSPNVQWEDIAALEGPKAVLQEAVVNPFLVPELYVGLRSPPKGILLFGPPGTGKTMLAKAVATCANTTFFNMTASSLLSKWHGESEKLVKTLFQLARLKAPSTIFLDEIDALASKRGGGNEHEASRRLKSELLSQIDGIHGDDSSSMLVLLATSNKPWDLDEAFRRRLEHRIHIPLPDCAARADCFRIGLRTLQGDFDCRELARRTDGYSCADILQVCSRAARAPVRRALAGKTPAEVVRMREEGLLEESRIRVEFKDFIESLETCKPSVARDELKHYAEWERDFGSK